MRKLSDILSNGAAHNLCQQWKETEAAVEFEALPTGEYVAHIIAGECINGRTNNTPGYRLTFRVLEGPYNGRQLWHDIWLTAAALPMAKRDLAKVGVNALEELDRPLPARIRCRVMLALWRDDNGAQFNRVRRFDVICIDTPEQDPFAPTGTTIPSEEDGHES
jgi:hypothetical protein